MIKINTRLRVLVTAGIAVFSLVTPLASASALSSTSLSLSDPRSSQAGVTYTFNSSGFTTGTTIRCIDLQLNKQADGGGAAAATTTSFTLTSATAITAGSWSVDNSTNGLLRLTNVTGETPSASGNIVYGTITNDSTDGTTYYGIFTSYTDTSCTGGNEVDRAVVAFVLQDGTLVELTIDPTLTFTCDGVASGQSVNGATTTIESFASSINFGNNVTAVANGIAAQDLSVTTNAAVGYTVSIRHTGLLTDGTNTIDAHTGTNGTPTSFPAAGTAAWGYTTEDVTLAGGTGNRFSSDLWAGFSTSNSPVMDNTTATAGTDTVRVGQQVGVAADTPAGTYQTTIIYTVASVY